MPKQNYVQELTGVYCGNLFWILKTQELWQVYCTTYVYECEMFNFRILNLLEISTLVGINIVEAYLLYHIPGNLILVRLWILHTPDWLKQFKILTQNQILRRSGKPIPKSTIEEKTIQSSISEGRSEPITSSTAELQFYQRISSLSRSSLNCELVHTRNGS